MSSRKFCAAWKKKQQTLLSLDEGGYLLAEFLISLPVYLVLLISIFAAWLVFLKSYVVLMGDWELQQVMRFALERIAQEAASSTHIEVKNAGALHIERYIQGEKCTTDYELCKGKAGDPPYISKKVTGGKQPYFYPQPMTGGWNIFGNLAVIEFSCQKQDGILFVRLTGENRRTKKRVTYSTAVCLPRGKE